MFVLGFLCGVVVTVVAAGAYIAFSLGEAFPKGPQGH